MVNKLLIVIPVLLAIAGGYLVMTAISASAETVELLPGHAVPKGLTGVLGALGIFGAIAIGVEMMNRHKRSASLASSKQ
jgi:hypothetical protein